MRRRSRTIVLLVAACIVLGACGDDGPSRGDVLGELATEVAIPRFDTFASTATSVSDAVDLACDEPTGENVSSALATVEDARLSWLSTQAVWTGPVMERRSDALVEWPIRAGDIDAFVGEAEPGSITPEVVAKNVGADTRGLSAIHYVLSADDVGDRLSDGAWCDYVRSAASVITEQAGLIVGDWSGSFLDGASFADQLADDDAAQGWLSMLVNANIFLVHKLTEEPRDLGDEPMDVGADRAAQLAGAGAVFGALGPLLGDELSARLTDEIDDARAAYADGDVERGRELSQAVEATLATEVAARLDVTIGFSDADGDSAG